MLSVHEGDAKGMWLAASAPILTYSAPIVGVSLLTKAVTGHGLPVSHLALLSLGFSRSLTDSDVKIGLRCLTLMKAKPVKYMMYCKGWLC